ncbi:hypothetical protein LCGC14_0296040 [marine sediment metagenome]|uniref:Uncharacterized protein n=1 Tax=marine sediment metagenome TaxID=412755 RepID=A0A0F9TWX2_9ZZZZ|nr:dCTP deaminase [Phycisphaerae bacterium]HDZ44191.1 dCTP deaminase [Phycisphaerae bacterium]
MSVVRESEIRERLERPLWQAGSARIIPKPSDGWDEDSVDLRLGTHFFVPRSHRSPHFCPGASAVEFLYQEEYIPFGDFIVVPAHNTVLGATLEYVKLPNDLSAQVLTKSSWARNFITIETAPWIHPFYRGCLTLEIANVSHTPIILYPGLQIAQLIFFDCPTPTPPDSHASSADAHPDTITGTYAGAVYPEPSKLESPTKALKSIGIQPRQVVHPYDEYADNIIGNPQYRERVINEALDDTTDDWRKLAVDKLAAHGYRIEPPAPNA